MIDTKCRQTFQRYLVKPVASYIHNTNTSPKTFTLASFVSGLLAVATVAFGSVFFSIFFLLLSAYLESLNGYLARMAKSETRSSIVIAMFSTRIIDLGMLFGFYWASTHARAFPCLFIMSCMSMRAMSAYIIEKFSESAEGKNQSPWLIERGETFIFFILFIIFPKLFSPLAYLFSLLLILSISLKVMKLLKQLHYEEL